MPKKKAKQQSGQNKNGPSKASKPESSASANGTKTKTNSRSKNSSANINDDAADVSSGYKHEAQRAWNAFMALHLNSALAQIDRKMEEETTSLLFPKSVARSSQKLLLAVGKEQSEVFYRLGELQQERDNIKRTLVECTESIKKGVPFDMVFDPGSMYSLELLESYVRDECGVDLQLANPSHSSATPSTDSAVHDLSELSDRQESPPLPSTPKSGLVERATDASAVAATACQDRFSDYEWVDDENTALSSHVPPGTPADAAAILDLLKPIEKSYSSTNNRGVNDTQAIKDLLAPYGPTPPIDHRYSVSYNPQEEALSYAGTMETKPDNKTNDKNGTAPHGAASEIVTTDSADPVVKKKQDVKDKNSAEEKQTATKTTPSEAVAPVKSESSSTSGSTSKKSGKGKKETKTSVADKLASDAANISNTPVEQKKKKKKKKAGDTSEQDLLGQPGATTTPKDGSNTQPPSKQITKQDTTKGATLNASKQAKSPGEQKTSDKSNEKKSVPKLSDKDETNKPADKVGEAKVAQDTRQPSVSTGTKLKEKITQKTAPAKETHPMAVVLTDSRKKTKPLTKVESAEEAKTRKDKEWKIAEKEMVAALSAQIESAKNERARNPADPMTPLVVECNAFSKWHEKTHGSGNGPLNLASNLYFYDTITGKMVSGVTTKVDTYSKTKDGLIIKETKQYPAGSTVESEASVTTYDAEEGKAIMAEAEAIKASLKAKSTQSHVITEMSRRSRPYLEDDGDLTVEAYCNSHYTAGYDEWLLGEQDLREAVIRSRSSQSRSSNNTVNEPKPASSEAFQYDHDRFEDLWDDCELSDDGSWETVKKKKPRQDSGADKTTVQDQNEDIRDSVCLDFINLGKCDYGDRCKYAHEQPRPGSAGSGGARSTGSKACASNSKSSLSRGTTPEAFSSPMENAMFSGEEGKMRRKTDICRAYQKGDCGWGSRCNYAHSEADMKVAREALNKWKLAKSSKIPSLVDDNFDPTQTSPMHNAAFSGEEGKMRRKTDMCRAFERGDCGWTSRCNYAHSRVELRAARYAYERWKETGTVTPSTSAPSTTAPTPATATKSQTNMTVANVSAGNAAERKWIMCKGYELGRCKRPGSECSYAHSVDELDPTLDHDEPCARQFCPGRLRYERRNTTMCADIEKTGSCMFGEDCAYAHKRSDIVRLPKYELCKRFSSNRGGCKASTCVYAHGKSELRKRPAGDRLVIPAPGSVKPKKATQPTTRSSQKAAAVKSSSSQVPTLHMEPCSRQFCPRRLLYETLKTSLCTSMVRGQCTAGPQCNKAHTKGELRPLPKYEMCSKFGGCGRCLPDNECPYAHSRAEQRPRPRNAVLPATRPGDPRLSQGAAATARPSLPTNNPNSQIQTRNANTEGAAATRPAGPPPSQGAAATARPAPPINNSNSQIQTRKANTEGAAATPAPWAEESANDTREQCMICFHPLDDRIDLECGHDLWHFRCISKWLNEMRPFCPMCNHPAILPDVYEAPAGLCAADFPSLGL